MPRHDPDCAVHDLSVAVHVDDTSSSMRHSHHLYRMMDIECVDRIVAGAARKGRILKTVFEGFTWEAGQTATETSATETEI